ncbi:viral A-type inclusion protein repeat protein [Babesia caballi]|uniref:Viral A-type inclusion protein repeat protein n=1 Tax=Babesia caballi TaxID=5871 RepID=A0AAV4LUT6_BABCB|nr:viral A-type inclusion protein repeat protein [Babesia caballi]
MGYSSGLKSDLNGSKIATLLGSEDDPIPDLKTIYNSDSPSYPDFLKKLQGNGKPNLPKNAMSAPLYALFAASHAYLQNNGKSLKIMELPQTKSDISKTLQGYSDEVKKLDGSNTRKLSTAYTNLLSQIKEAFIPDPPSPASSSAGAAAGGVLGTAAIGGTAAALATNVGGVTTTFKSLIPIFK